mgnify:CR=1 FL=1
MPIHSTPVHSTLTTNTRHKLRVKASLSKARVPFTNVPTRTKRKMAKVPGAPDLGTIVDSASEFDVFTQVHSPQPCNIQLTGANKTSTYSVRGTVACMDNVIHSDSTPANIMSMSRMLTEGVYDILCFQRDSRDHSKHDVWGLNFEKRIRTLVAFRDPLKNPFYTVTEHGLNYKSFATSPDTHSEIQEAAHTMVSTVGSSNDIHEPVITDSHMRRLMMPSPTTLARIASHKTIKNLHIDKAYLRRWNLLGNESRMVGGMTAPPYRAPTATSPSDDNIQFLDKLYGDSKQLHEPGPNGEKYVFTVVDQCTGYTWSFGHKSFTDLPLLLERLVVQIHDQARSFGCDQPQIKRFYIDGHPTQKGRLPSTVTDIERMLHRHQIFVPQTSPGMHRQMGLVERMHRQLDKNAKATFHECGRGLPKSFFYFAYMHASKVQPFLPQRSRPNMTSAFELASGIKPDMNVHVPYPTLFSTGIGKDLDTPKQGSDRIGIVVDTMSNTVRGRQSVLLYVPATGSFVQRLCIFNESFSTHPVDRVQRLAKNELCHSLTSTMTPTNHGRANTRARVQELGQIKLTRMPLNGMKQAERDSLNAMPGRPGDSYLRATRFGNDIHSPFGCAVAGCSRNGENGTRTMGGLKSHLRYHLKQARTALITEEQTTLPATSATTLPATSALRTEERVNTTVPTTSALNAEEQVNTAAPSTEEPTTNTAALSTEEPSCTTPSTGEPSTTAPQSNTRSGANYCRKYCLMAHNRWHAAERTVKPWRLRERGQKATKLRKEKRISDMNAALQRDTFSFQVSHKPAKSVHDYATERHIQHKYQNLPMLPDPTPQFSPFSADVDETVRSILGISDKDDDSDTDDPLGIDNLRLSTVPGVESHHNETQGFVYIQHNKVPVTPALLSHITQENALRLTPTNTKSLMRSKYLKHWLKAMQIELDTLNQYDAFDFVKIDHKVKRISLMWIFKIKFNDGKLQKFKARLVARGFTQEAHTDYDPEGVSSPVCRNSTIKCVMADGVKNHHHFEEFDVKCAYLLSELKKDIYCSIPYGVELVPGTNTMKLNKSLYGLRQSGYNWYTKFSKVIVDLGFKRSTVDPCLFVYDKDGDIIRIAIWVDDGIVSTNNINLWHDIRDKIHAITPLGSFGELGWLLGMSITYDRRKGIMRISQQAKIEALLERYGMSDCNPVDTPIWHKEKLINDGPDTPADERAVLDSVNKISGGVPCFGGKIKKRYSHYKDVVQAVRKIIGSLGHLACWGRPDIRQSVYLMARFQSRPSLRHFKILKRMLQYMKGTQHLQLTFGTRSFNDKSPLICMVDANYVGDGDSCYSTTGYVYWLYGCPILCDSRKQTAVSTSTTEAELIAASMAAKTGRYLRRLLQHDFGLGHNGSSTPVILPNTPCGDALPPTPMGEDNQGTIDVSRGGGKHRKLRHIRVSDSYIYQGLQLGHFSMHYVRSKDNVADIFTKSADPATFVRLRWLLMGDSPTEHDEVHPRSAHMTFFWPVSRASQSTAEECWKDTTSPGHLHSPAPHTKPVT